MHTRQYDTKLIVKASLTLNLTDFMAAIRPAVLIGLQGELYVVDGFDMCLILGRETGFWYSTRCSSMVAVYGMFVA